MLGIDVVIPDITYLLENREYVHGIVLTHGHEDHIGALPYVLRQLNVPVYGTKLTLGLLHGKLKEQNIAGDVELHTVRPRDSVQIGPFKIDLSRYHTVFGCRGHSHSHTNRHSSSYWRF